VIKLRSLVEGYITDDDLKLVKQVMRQNKGWKPNPDIDVSVGDTVMYRGKKWFVVDGRKYKIDLWDGKNDMEYAVRIKEIKK